jgi:hypothetical protein
VPASFRFSGVGLAAILESAKGADHIIGVILHLILVRVSHLQYADDTIIMIQPEDLEIANLKFILLYML